MINKDLSWRPVWNSLRIKHTSNAQGYTCQVSHRWSFHTLTHPDTNMLCWCHIFRKPFFNISRSRPLFTDTHLGTWLRSSLPLYSSIQSSLCSASTSPLTRLIKDPGSLCRDTFLYHYVDILFRYSAPHNLGTHSLLETFSSLGFMIPHFPNFHLFYFTACCFLVTFGRSSSTWPLKAGIPPVLVLFSSLTNTS